MSKKILLGAVIVAGAAGAGIVAMNEVDNVNSQVKVAVDSQIEKMEMAYPDLDINYGEIKVNLDKSVNINDITVSSLSNSQVVPVGDLKINKYDYEHKIPYFYDIQLNTTITDELISNKLDSTNKEEQRLVEILSRIKGEKDDIDVTFKVSQEYDHELKSTEQYVEVDVEDAFNFRNNIILDKFDYEVMNSFTKNLEAKVESGQMAAIQQEAMDTIGRIKLTELYFELENKGIVKELISMSAKEAGVNEAEFKKQISKKLLNPAIQGVSKENVAEYFKIVEKFIAENEHDTIYLKVSPNFETLMDGFNFILMASMQGGEQSEVIEKIKERLNIEFNVK